MARVDDLKHRVSELEQQLQETKQEVNTHTHTQADTPHLYALSIFTSRYLRSLAAFGGPQTVTRCLSLGGDGAGPAAGGAAGRAGAGGGRE